MKPASLPLLLIAFAAGIGLTLAFQALTRTNPTSTDPAGLAQSDHKNANDPASIPIGMSPDSTAPKTFLTSEKDQPSDPAKDALTRTKNQRRKAKEAAWQKNWVEQIREQAKKKNDARLAYLAEELGLTPGQIARMEAALAKDLEAPQKTANADEDSHLGFTPVFLDPMAAALAEVMNPDQKLAYAELKEKERAHNVEARTMQRFAALPEILNLSEQQRDQVYDLIAREEAESFSENPSTTLGGLTIAVPSGETTSRSFTINLGSTIPSPILVASGNEADGTPQEALDNALNDAQQRNEERVEAMRPLLNDRQLEAYRDHINQTGGIIRTDVVTEVQVDIVEDQVFTE